MKEIWKDIKGYEGFYQVSNLGRIKSIPRNGTIKNSKILKQNVVRGYGQIALQKRGKIKYEKVHRLVAKMFIFNQNNLPEVNHIDGNKLNNNVSNLEWVTTRDNQLHSVYVLGNNNFRIIEQYDKEGNFIKEWKQIVTASKELKINATSIVKCCRKKRKSAGGYVWKYKNNY